MHPSDNIKICLASSSGGHLLKTYMLKKWWGKYPHFWVVNNDKFTLSLLKNEKKYFGYFPENRHVRNAIRNLFLAIKILQTEKPSLVYSMGAGIAPPFLLAAKVMGIKTVFIETFNFIPKTTFSGQILYPFVDHFVVQNKKLLKFYPKAIFVGSILKI